MTEDKEERGLRGRFGLLRLRLGKCLRRDKRVTPVLESGLPAAHRDFVKVMMPMLRMESLADGDLAGDGLESGSPTRLSH